MAVVRCLVDYNSAGQGGGITNWLAPRCEVTNCTVVYNHGDDAGGIRSVGTSVTIANTVIAYNSNFAICLWEVPGGNSITYCDFWSNNRGGNSAYPTGFGSLTTTNANGTSCDQYQNIFSDPLFVNATLGVYHLQSTSPCIDAGAPSATCDPDSTITDMGAFPFTHETPLAVELLSFYASAVENGIALNWRTASERENDHFEIFRRAGSDWRSIAVVPAAANAATGASYHWIDTDVTAAQSYTYKLVVVDFGGAHTDAGEVTATAPGHASAITAFELLPNYPNPFNSSTVFTWLAPAAVEVRLVLYNVLGEAAVPVFSGTCAAGTNRVAFAADDLPTGFYFARLETKGHIIASQKLLLIR